MKHFLHTTLFECKQALKRPLSWIAIIPLTALILINFSPYLFTDFPVPDYETYVQQIKTKKDGNITNYGKEMGVPLSEWESYAITMQNYCHFCAYNFKLDFEQIYKYVIENRLSYADEDWSALNDYLYDLVPEERKEYFIRLSPEQLPHFRSNLHVGDYDKWNNYRDNTLLSSKPYTEWVGQRFGDMGGVAMLFYSFIVFTSTFSQEVKKESYELLHSKKMRSGTYVLSKWLGCGMAAVLIGMLLALLVDALAVWHCYDLGIACSLFAVCKYYFWWIVPSMLMVNALISVCTLLCGSGIPMIPLLVFWTMGGTIPVTDAKGYNLYVQAFWNITVRISNFADALFIPLPQEFYNGVILHKLFQLLVIIVCMGISILLYSKKKPLEKNRF